MVMPKDKELRGARHRLERPVSCRFCRSRKLRCSREAPCSNCVSRGIICQLAVENTIRSTTPNASQPELLERIRKLEELVESQKLYTNSAVQHPRQGPESPESFGTPHTLQTHISRSTSPDVEHLNEDVAWLKSIYTAQNLSDNTSSSKIAFRVCSIQQITQAQSYIDQSAHLSSARFEPFRCVWLPQYAEAKILLQKFIDDIDHVHHITHSPSLPAILDEVYACLSQQVQVKPGSIMLLLGIFASSTHAWVKCDSARGLFPTWQEANAQAVLWVKAIEDVLDIFHRTSSVPIEGIQGISIAIFTVLNMEGFSRRCKSLFNMAFMLARELGLHFLDQPSNMKLANSAQTEIGRRVWWYLVAADWSLPSRRFNCGSQNIYHCHPRHMLVRKPLNINDEDVIDGMRCTEQVLSQPTTMSFQLLQLRLSEISHNMVDRSPLIMGLAGPNHDVVMNIDTELQMLLNDTPAFFSMTVAELTANYQLDPSRASKIVHQGYMFYSLLYAQRCTLHIPYFTRGLTDPAFASSSQICLQSARLVIQTESQLGTSRISATRYKFLGFLVPLFMASIVLLMDLYHSKTSSNHAKHREELAEALRILEEAKHESETAAKFLDSLTHVLRKHEVSPAPRPAEQLFVSPNVANTPPQLYGELPLPMLTSSALGGSDIILADGIYTNGDDVSTYFNELAQSFEQGIEVGSVDWNNMFSGIDSSMIWI
ncbi:hypothetical protein SBOR_0643 [Sclerotinia borealis F-4128]|uniref:Zn(2)-C6 fungal-type domain-containing protein n=1 Tax=Sclerotinia borealis (strain F-4128) TaxID=1432307 RepID=W9CWP3_SCLBF|nr:hypothetical protein SBOR_0643 [Sclerotinia borealis F-4128]